MSLSRLAHTLMHLCELIYDIDKDSIIVVCAAGRASSYVAVMAMLLGLHVRVGMEDTIWEYPHKDELITSNAANFLRYKTIAELLGREVADGNEYRELIGLPKREVAAGASTHALA